MTRVAVTGLGIYSPLGKKVEEFWQNIIAGKNAFRDINCFSYSKKIKTKGYIFPEKTNNDPQLFSWIFKVAEQAISDAKLNKAPQAWIGAIHPFLHHPLKQSLTAWLNDLTADFKVKQKPIMINGACASGNLALGYAADLIRYQNIPAVLVFGGNEVNEIIYTGFNSLKVLSPEGVTPFSRGRQGMGLGEGAVALVLEAEDKAKKRGAKIHGFIRSWSSTLDGHNTTGLSESGYGPSAALWWALEKAKLNPGEVQWICAHGTGTKINDLVETKSIKQIFKEAAHHLFISSNKGQIGHLLEAAGLVNTVIILLALKQQMVLGTYNYQEKDEECDLEYLPNRVANVNLKRIISNAYGFGGICSSLVIEKGEI
ncbi:MAG: beta-ketoacyl-[acyl-carrier-protein] synthase family protein [Candidatus Margulisbacteria bacterium]|nr:beta-ketoacyl-[acyl-carrier-protein] synthase family protein [Candidatus Margulisiibacteriota bacterium]